MYLSFQVLSNASETLPCSLEAPGPSSDAMGLNGMSLASHFGSAQRPHFWILASHCLLITVTTLATLLKWLLVVSGSGMRQLLHKPKLLVCHAPIGLRNPKRSMSVFISCCKLLGSLLRTCGVENIYIKQIDSCTGVG